MSFVISITDIDDKKSIDVWLEKHQFWAIMNVLLPIFKAELNQDDFDYIRGSAEGLGQLDLGDLPKDIFNQVCHAIFKVCQENGELKSHAQELTDKLKADPRFT